MWKEVGGVVNDKRLPLHLKSFLYKMVIRPVLLYASATWALRKKNLLRTPEM